MEFAKASLTGSNVSRKDLTKLFGFKDRDETVPVKQGGEQAMHYSRILAQSVAEVQALEAVKTQQVAADGADNRTIVDAVDKRLDRIKLRLRAFQYFRDPTGAKKLAKPIVVYDQNSCPMGSGVYGAEQDGEAFPSLMQVPGNQAGIPVKTECSEDGSLAMNVFIRKNGELQRCYPKHCFIRLNGDRKYAGLGTSDSALNTLSSAVALKLKNQYETLRGQERRDDDENDQMKKLGDFLRNNYQDIWADINGREDPETEAVSELSAESLGRVQYPVLASLFSGEKLVDMFEQAPLLETLTQAQASARALLMTTREAAAIQAAMGSGSDEDRRLVAITRIADWNAANPGARSHLDLVGPKRTTSGVKYLVLPRFVHAERADISESQKATARRFFNGWYKTVWPRLKAAEMKRLNKDTKSLKVIDELM